jgi:hypothetical protein
MKRLLAAVMLTIGTVHAETPPPPKLNIPLDPWVQQMNTALKSMKMKPLSTSTEPATCDVWCTRSYESGEFISYLVSYRDDKIHEVMSLASGDGSVKSGADILFGSIIMANVLSPKAKNDKVSEVVMKLIGDAFDGKKVKPVVMDGISYSASHIDSMGLFISASKPDSK